MRNIDERNNQAEKYIKSGDITAAKSIYEDIVCKSPDKETCYKLGILHYLYGDKWNDLCEAGRVFHQAHVLGDSRGEDMVKRCFLSYMCQNAEGQMPCIVHDEAYRFLSHAYYDTYTHAMDGPALVSLGQECYKLGRHEIAFNMFYAAQKGSNNACASELINKLFREKAPFNLFRFLNAQAEMYYCALDEIREAGQRKTAWMWYIFPQLRGLGHSSNSVAYGIANLDEAQAYLLHPILGRRLIEISGELLKLKTNDPSTVVGHPDDLKLRSCMTLFSLIGGANSVFEDVLGKFYNGAKDTKTVELLYQRLKSDA